MRPVLKRVFFVWGTLLVGLLLSILPVPAFLEPFRPDWLTAIVLYWVIALPHRVNVGFAWCAGLLLDILLGSTIGVRALAMAIVAYIAATQFQRLRNYSVGQQSIVIGLFVLLSKLTVLWSEQLFNAGHVSMYHLWSVASTMLLWPWIFLVLRKIRRQVQIT